MNITAPIHGVNHAEFDEYGIGNFCRYVHNNPVNYTDPTGLETYSLDRKIGGDGPVVAEPVSHTFIFTTDDSGKLLHTYSWGNAYEESNPSHWYKDRREDVKAAKAAMASRLINIAIANDEGGLDWYVEEAFHELHDAGAKSASAHGWAVWSNCKHEKEYLLKLAKLKKADDEKVAQKNLPPANLHILPQAKPAEK